jgi:hypothetical protein
MTTPLRTFIDTLTPAERERIAGAAKAPAPPTVPCGTVEPTGHGMTDEEAARVEARFLEDVRVNKHSLLLPPAPAYTPPKACPYITIHRLDDGALTVRSSGSGVRRAGPALEVACGYCGVRQTESRLYDAGASVLLLCERCAAKAGAKP